MGVSEREYDDRKAFTDALYAEWERAGEPDFPRFASAFSGGWIAHRDHPRGVVDPEVERLRGLLREADAFVPYGEADALKIRLREALPLDGEPATNSGAVSTDVPVAGNAASVPAQFSGAADEEENDRG